MLSAELHPLRNYCHGRLSEREGPELERVSEPSRDLQKGRCRNRSPSPGSEPAGPVGVISNQFGEVEIQFVL